MKSESPSGERLGFERDCCWVGTVREGRGEVFNLRSEVGRRTRDR